MCLVWFCLVFVSYLLVWYQYPFPQIVTVISLFNCNTREHTQREETPLKMFTSVSGCCRARRLLPTTKHDELMRLTNAATAFYHYRSVSLSLSCSLACSFTWLAFASSVRCELRRAKASNSAFTTRRTCSFDTLRTGCTASSRRSFAKQKNTLNKL